MTILEDLEKQTEIKPTGNAGMLKPCSRCGHKEFEVKFCINKDGKTCYPYFCKKCNNRSPIIETKDYAKSLGFFV
jgi:hypothetical protein